MSVEFVTLGPGQRLATWEDLVVVHLAAVPEPIVARAIFDVGLVHGAPGRLGLVYVVERSGVGVPSAAARDAFVELSRTSEPYYVASTVVIPGGGLAAATAHAFVGGVRALSGGRLPLAVFADLPHAVGWLRQVVPPTTRLPDDDAIDAVLARMRAAQGA